MFLQIIIVITIVLLIFTNGITDAPNAIATIVGSKTMKFKKAAFISAIFNFIGIIVMSFINISVADCISSMVNLNDTKRWNDCINFGNGICNIICINSNAIWNTNK